MTIIPFQHKFFFQLSMSPYCVSSFHLIFLSILIERDDLPYLFRRLHRLASNWEGFCLQLGVKNLGQIKIKGTTVDDCLVLALRDWLIGDNVSWKVLITAIFRRAGGGHQVLARDIAESFKGELTLKQRYLPLIIFCFISFLTEMCHFEPIEQAITTSTDCIRKCKRASTHHISKTLQSHYRKWLSTSFVTLYRS